MDSGIREVDSGHPVIIVKKKQKAHGHHGGAWKVAYADFVTAMMALFIVLWLLASSQEVQKAVGGYFQDPTGAGKMAGTTHAGVGESITLTGNEMDQLKDKLEQAMRELPKFEQLKSNVLVTVTNEGLRIELLENEGGLFFESGSAMMSERGASLMRLLGEQLKAIPNRCLLEGHTDAKPYASTGGYTNWELSVDRANSARRLLEESGLPREKFAQIRGFADQYLRNPSNPMDPHNRRVSLIVQYRTPPPNESQQPAKEHSASTQPEQHKSAAAAPGEPQEMKQRDK